MAGKCEYFYRLQKLGAVAAAKRWLKSNPTPKGWKHSAWRWAFEQMPIDELG
ncbi:hypothetical protein [Pseudomonas sp.]|uniref:hypothetical protein n=1 Tax=Pseudomonas sp. TaxID=306 RepID=UPI003D0D8D9D